MPQLLQQSELPLCSVCNQTPVPQSTQSTLFIIIQIMMVFVNFKLAIITFFIGYSLSYIIWKCPVCSRFVEVEGQDPNIENNIIIRMGKCMGIITKTKFRILTIIIVILVGYWFWNEQPKFYNKVRVDKTWESIAKNCGYEMYIENSYRANYLYQQYIESGNDWILQGIYIGKEDLPAHIYENLKIKMNPTQFADPEVQDFLAMVRVSDVASIGGLEKGDQIKIYGEWEGRIYHKIMFMVVKIEKIGKGDLNNVKLFSALSLRSHS